MVHGSPRAQFPYRLVDEVVEGHLASKVPYPHRPVHRASQHLIPFCWVPIAPRHPRHVALRVRHVLYSSEIGRAKQATHLRTDFEASTPAQARGYLRNTHTLH